MDGADSRDLERVRQSIESAPDVGAALAFFAPDARWEAVDLGFRLEGVEALRGFLEDWYSSYEETTLKAENLRGLGNGVFVGEIVQEGRLASSPGTVRQRSGTAVVVRDGAIAQVLIYREAEEALAGASELASGPG